MLPEVSSARAAPLRPIGSDLLALGLLLAGTALFARLQVDFSIPPFEDAAMLMRYAEHLAQGHGVVWNVGEPPVDGATDFLFMVAIALARRLGLSLEGAVRTITVGSHVATVAIVYAGMRSVQRSGRLPALLSAAYFAVGPGLFLAAAYFGAPFFAMGIAVAWLLAQRLLEPRGASTPACAAFSLACLEVGLVRPEGVLLALLMLVAVLPLLPRRDGARLVAVFSGVFLVLGGAYFVWRWGYFGHPLPNPFYKKGGGRLHLDGLAASLQNGGELMLPFTPAFLLSALSPESRRKGLAFLLPVAGFIGMWALLSNEANFGARFQYPVLVLCLLSWFPLLDARIASSERMRRRMPRLVLATACVALFIRHVHLASRIAYARDGRHDLGIALGEYAGHGYRMATTEAGLLPLYSRWPALDTWGLNDPWIARHGGVTEDYLERWRPDVVLIHDIHPDLLPPTSFRDEWTAQVRTLTRFVESGGYTRAASFGVNPYDTHRYYVHPSIPHHDEIVARIASFPYRWYLNGQLCRSYFPPP